MGRSNLPGGQTNLLTVAHPVYMLFTALVWRLFANVWKIERLSVCGMMSICMQRARARV